MRYALRFVWVTLLSSVLLTFAAHLFVPSFDRSRDTLPEDAAEDRRDAICLWTAILLIPTIDLVRNTRRKPPSALDPM